MKKKKINIRLIWIIIIFILIALAVFVSIFKNKNKSNNENNGNNENISYRYIKILDDNSKINTSSKLSEVKSFEGLEFSDLKLVSSDGVSTLTGTITNKTDSVQTSRYFNCYMIDENNNVQYTLAIFLKKDLEPNETTTFGAGITLDNVNIYDFYIDAYTENQ